MLMMMMMIVGYAPNTLSGTAHPRVNGRRERSATERPPGIILTAVIAVRSLQWISIIRAIFPALCVEYGRYDI